MTSPQAFPSGTRVKLHSLKSNPALNARPGTVLLTADNSTPPRHTVYLHPHGKYAPITVRVQLKNLTAVPLPTPPPAPPPPPFSIKLNSFTLSTVPNSPSLYYPFGNTSPTYVLPSIPRDAPSASVLLLAAGDLRSALYSLARDAPPRSSPRLHFFYNDLQPTIIARNLALLWLIRRTNASPETIFALWFSLSLSATAYTALVDAVTALTGERSEAELGAINVAFHTERDRRQVFRVLHSWLGWQDHLDWSTVKQRREEALMKSPASSASSMSEYAQGMANIVTLRYGSAIAGDTQFPLAAAERETKRYVETGVVAFGEELEYTNPTLFLTPHTYDLHYASDPFSAFPMFDSGYDNERPLMNMCVGYMREWVDAARVHGDNVSWTFSTEDCMSLVTRLEQQFDVISSSNVSDAVGLLPLLQATRGLVKPSGYLLTQTLRFAEYSDSIDHYLSRNLIVDPEFFASVLGWRCVGHEGNLKPENGDILFDPPNLVEALAASINKQEHHSAGRCELNLMWCPANESDVPLYLPADDRVTQLLRELKPRFERNSESDMMCTGRPPWSQAHPLTMLPLMLQNVGGEKLLREEEDETVEILDIIQFLREEQREMILVTMSFAHSDVQRPIPAIPSVLYAASPYKNVYIGQAELVVLVETCGRTLPYWGLSYWFDERNDCWHVSWLMRKDRLTADSVITLQAAPKIVAKCHSNRLVVKQISSTEASQLFRRKKQAQAANLHLGRSEDKLTWSIPIKIPDTWWKAINEKKDLQTVIIKESNVLKVGLGKKFADCKLFHLPGPASPRGIRLELSRKRRIVTCIVKKGQYDLQSLLPKSVFLDDEKGVLLPSPLEEQFLVSMSGMQFSERERIIARAMNLERRPPLIDLKDTLLFFFQIQDEPYMTLAVKKGKGENVVPDVHAIVAHHGIRRDHRTGTPIVDMSICFLEHSFVQQVGNWHASNARERGGPQRHIYCTMEELQLMKLFVQAFAFRLKDSESWKVKPLQAPIQELEIRKRFTRVLISPLTSPTVIDNLFSKRGS